LAAGAIAFVEKGMTSMHCGGQFAARHVKACESAGARRWLPAVVFTLDTPRLWRCPSTPAVSGRTVLRMSTRSATAGSEAASTITRALPLVARSGVSKLTGVNTARLLALAGSR
jgi:hypothetical protein